MDYGPMIAYHEQCEADITVGVVDVPIERANEFGILTTDETNRVNKFAEKPNNPITSSATRPWRASMASMCSARIA